MVQHSFHDISLNLFPPTLLELALDTSIAPVEGLPSASLAGLEKLSVV